jgi:SAM-dependent methyltransferase
VVAAGDASPLAGTSEPEVAGEAKDKRLPSSPDIVIDEDIPPEMADPPSPPAQSNDAVEVEEAASEREPVAPAPPKAPVTDETLDAEDIGLESEPPPRSEPADLAEVSPEDVVSVESVPGKPLARKAGHISKPPAAPPPAPPVARPPLLLVPGSASPLAPPPMSEAAATRRRARPWWEDLFNDDFIRTMAKVTDAQIATEVNFIEESLGLAKGAVVLDLACGTGRHAIEMTSRGYQVVGFDLSLAMLARAADEAQERDQKLNFVQGDMREMTFEETFDGVYAWNTSFGFFEEEKNSGVISNLHRALKAGGLLLLDVANRDYLARQSPSLAWFEGDGCVCMDEMHVDWITSRMRVKRTMMLDDGRTRETDYSIRVYALHELGKILHDHGFRVAEVSGRVATPGVFFGADSPRILVVAEKR